MKGPRPEQLPDPPAERVIDDVGQLKVVSDPLRLQLLYVMSEEARRAFSAKELAEQLGTKQTKLYHHLALLEEGGFIRVAETRVVSGIIEKRYQVTAHSFRVKRGLFTPDTGEAAMAGILDAIFDKTRAEILAAVRAGLADMSLEDEERRDMVLWSTYARLSPASRRKVMRQIKRLAELERHRDPDGDEYALVVALYPRVTRDSDR